MKKMTTIVAGLMLWLGAAQPVTAWAEMLIPVGQVVGLEIGDDSVIVAAYDEALGNAARDAGLLIGDEILRIDGMEIDSAEDVRQALLRSDGHVSVVVERDGGQRTCAVTPSITGDGPRLGVYLRCGITGIGTVTYYNPATGCFGTLGHGVSNRKGELLQMAQGKVYRASVLAVKKGVAGEPGQLRGALEPGALLGELADNTVQGVFGRVDSGWEGQMLPTADYDEIRTGPAVIRSTVSSDGVREYSVEILKIYPQDRPDGRHFLLRVTDPALLETTGGIIQGMSGSPIIQDGKLVGAVTHVLVNDPTTGYGIFIENMLDAAA